VVFGFDAGRLRRLFEIRRALQPRRQLLGLLFRELARLLRDDLFARAVLDLGSWRITDPAC
jgi:hypothetical protein